MFHFHFDNYGGYKKRVKFGQWKAYASLGRQRDSWVWWKGYDVVACFDGSRLTNMRGPK